MITSQRESLQTTPAWVRAASNVIRHLPAGRYQVMNYLSRRLPATFIRQMPSDKGGLLFECNLQDAIAREVCFTGCYEPQETALVRVMLKPGMTFVDVGANWGYFTLMGAGLIGDAGRVISFEPDPRLFRILDDNIKLNRLTYVTPVCAAAADVPGTLTLAAHDETSEKWGISKLVEHPTAEMRTFSVPARPVDATLDDHDIGEVDLLKMDIEGAEELALIGMREGLMKHRYRRILLEIHPTILAERHRAVQDVLNLLTSKGYRGWWIDFSPEATRRAAYNPSLKLSDYMQEIDGVPSDLDTWCHTLWLAPNVDSCF